MLGLDSGFHAYKLSSWRFSLTPFLFIFLNKDSDIFLR